MDSSAPGHAVTSPPPLGHFQILLGKRRHVLYGIAGHRHHIPPLLYLLLRLCPFALLELQLLPLLHSPHVRNLHLELWLCMDVFIQRTPRAPIPERPLIRAHHHAVFGPGRCHIHQPLLLSIGIPLFLFRLILPSYRLRQCRPLKHPGLFAAQKISLRGHSLPDDVFVRIVPPHTHRIGQKNEGGLQSLGLVKVHQPHGVFSSRGQAHFFNLVYRDELLQVVHKLGKGCCSSHLLVAQDRQELEKIPGPAASHLGGCGIVDDARILEDHLQSRCGRILPDPSPPLPQSGKPRRNPVLAIPHSAILRLFILTL